MDELKDEFPNLDLEDILRRQLANFAISSEISRIVSSSTSLEAVVQTLGLGFQEMLGYKRVAIFRLDREGFCLDPMGCAGMDIQELRDLRFGLEFIAGEYGDAIFRNRHVIVENIPEDDVFHALGTPVYAMFPMVGRITSNCWESRSCGCMACPCFEQPGTVCWATEGAALFVGARAEDDRRRACVHCPQFKCLGAVWLDLTGRAMITGDDVSVISSIMLQTGLVTESFQIYDLLKANYQELNQTYEALEDANRRIRRDLERAKGVQTKLLPAEFPKGLRGVAAHYAAHIEIGGDYYDCFEVGPDLYALVIADVSGHGVSAALVMSMFKTLLKQVAQQTTSPAETLRRVNQAFVSEVNTDMFVTTFYGIWDKSNRVLRWTSAGHTPILLMNQQSGSIQELSSQGLFLGMFDEIRCGDQECPIEGEQRILLYTDGIVEAANATGEQFGPARLVSCLQEARGQSPKECLQIILERLQQHIGNTPLADDLTLLCCDL
ncbi:MAG TPA: PP2C family protein-serine/threonine phosphatase [Fibrobacteraceae bacterium]|nr:PP2C family protein-serine/threonine phosphatase [Fibrobacteraceae bacterium]